MGTDEAIVLVGEKAIRSEVEWPSLVGTEIEPSTRLTGVPGDDQPHGLLILLDLEFAVLAFGQIVGRAKEHWFIHGV